MPRSTRSNRSSSSYNTVGRSQRYKESRGQPRTHHFHDVPPPQRSHDHDRSHPQGSFPQPGYGDLHPSQNYSDVNFGSRTNPLYSPTESPLGSPRESLKSHQLYAKVKPHSSRIQEQESGHLSNNRPKPSGMSSHSSPFSSREPSVINGNLPQGKTRWTPLEYFLDLKRRF